MALPPNWYFGARTPFGAWNVGNVRSLFDPPAVQSTVASPNPATAGVAGTPAGQLAPTGGMRALDVPFAPGPSATSPAPAPSGPGFSVGEAAGVAGRGGVFGIPMPFGNIGPSTVGSVAGRGLTMAGVPNPLGMFSLPIRLANSLTNVAAHHMVDPATGLPVDQLATNPGTVAASTAFDPSVPAQGNPNTTLGRIIAAIQNSNSLTGSTGGHPFGSEGLGFTIAAQGNISNSLGTKTGEAHFKPTPKAQEPDPNEPTTSGPTGPGPTGPGPGQGGQAPGNDASVPGTGTPGTAGAPGSGGTGAGSSPGEKFGGPVDDDGKRKPGQRPSPKYLAAKLQAGARVLGKIPSTAKDNVRNVDLMSGEFV